jgi:hypothetical protein
MSGAPCDHIEAVESIKLPRRRECEECVKAEPGERWSYCYPDDAFAEY